MIRQRRLNRSARRCRVAARLGRPAGLDGFKLAHHFVEMARRAPCRACRAELPVVEGRHPHGVLLAHHQVGEHRGQVRGVLQLGDPRWLAIAHRAEQSSRIWARRLVSSSYCLM